MVADEVVRRHVERWREVVASRMYARHPKPWDCRRFLLQLWADAPDYPGAVDLAGEFEQASRVVRWRDFATDRRVVR